MTEYEWLASTDPAAMLEFLRIRHEPGGYEPVSDRKLRLFACACWRVLDPRPRWDTPPGRLDRVEAMADAGATERDFRELDHLLAGPAVQWARHQCSRDPGRGRVAGLLREVVGNPFRPVTLPTGACVECGITIPPGSTVHNPGPCPWLTPTVLALAHAAYAERLPDGLLDPDRLAVLADCLEDAGCDSMELLAHLRGDWVNRAGERVRGFYRDNQHCLGCWALDLILGKG